MSDAFVNISLSDSLMQNYSSGDKFYLFSEYPNGKYSNSSLIVSSSSTPEAAPSSSSSHPNYYVTGSVRRYKYDDYYDISHSYSVAQKITTNNRNWYIDNDGYGTQDTVISGSGNDTIKYAGVVSAGAGNDVIYLSGGYVRGGTGDDIIRCDYAEANKENVVVFEAQNGNDIIYGYADTIQWEAGFTGLSVGQYEGYYGSSSYTCTKTYLGLHASDGTEYLGTNDQWVKVASSTGAEIAQIYLESGYFDKGLIDGTKFNSMEVLIGNSKSDTIKAGSGGASIWGGVGADDSLVGGSGSDVFFYGSSDGMDFITNGNAADRVVLYDTAPIQSVAQSGSDLVIQYASDNKLTIRNWSESGMNNFQIFDGSVWGVHFENGSPTYFQKG